MGVLNGERESRYVSQYGVDECMYVCSASRGGDNHAGMDAYSSYGRVWLRARIRYDIIQYANHLGEVSICRNKHMVQTGRQVNKHAKDMSATRQYVCIWWRRPRADIKQGILFPVYQ